MFIVRSSFARAQTATLTPCAGLTYSMHEIEIEKDKIKSDPGVTSLVCLHPSTSWVLLTFGQQSLEERNRPSSLDP